MVKCTYCSCKGLGFNSQHPHGGSQLSVTLVPVGPSCGLKEHCTHVMQYKYSCTDIMLVLSAQPLNVPEITALNLYSWMSYGSYGRIVFHSFGV